MDMHPPTKYAFTDEGQVNFILDHATVRFDRGSYTAFNREMVLSGLVTAGTKARLRLASEQLYSIDATLRKNESENTLSWEEVQALRDAQSFWESDLRFAQSLGSYARHMSVRKMLERVLLDSFVVDAQP